MLTPFAVVNALTIDPTYDSSVTGLSYFSQVQSAVNYAIGQYQALYSDPITINITISATTGILGESNTKLQLADYTTVRNALIADAKTTNDATSILSLGPTDPTNGATFLVPFAEAKAIGLRSATDTATDGTFFFGSDQTYTFDPNNRAAPGAYDFIGVAEHEFSEIMGRIGIIGQNLTGGPDYSPYDLFAFTAPNVRSLSANDTNAYFSINDGVTNLRVFNGPGNGGDLRDWADGQGVDAYNAFASIGQREDISNVDQTAMDVIGYDLVPEPSPLAMVVIGWVCLFTVMCHRRRSGRFVGAGQS